MKLAEGVTRRIKGRIAEAGIRRRDVARAIGYSESMFSLILQGDRTMPSDFESRVYAALDLLEAAEKAGQEARQRVLSAGRPTPADALKGAAQGEDRADGNFDVG